MLSSEHKWRRAIELGDLTPDTVVEALRGGEPIRGPASQIAELAPLFLQCGFVASAEAEMTAVPQGDGVAPTFPRDQFWVRQGAFKIERPLAVAVAHGEDIQVETPPVKRDKWPDIAKAPGPGPDPDLPNRLKWLGPESQRKLARVRDLRRAGSYVLGGTAVLLVLSGANPLWSIPILAAAFGLWPWPPVEAGRAARKDVRERSKAWNALLQDWRAKASRARFDAIVGQLRGAQQGLEALDRRRASMLAAFDNRDNQLKEHLATFPIEAGRIPGIGPSHVRALQRIGYRTAADLGPTTRTIAALGESATRTLIGWRAGCAATFTHNPNRSKEPQRIRYVDDILRPERTRLEKPFEGALRRLHDTRAEIIAARADLQPKLRAAWFSLREARLNRQAL
jgi:hypothetical protein